MLIKGAILILQENEILADMHTHTIFSLHAHSTVLENIQAAKSRGLKFLAVTDHFYQDGSSLNQKNEVTRIRHLEETVNLGGEPYVFAGAEFNIGQEIHKRHQLELLRWRPIGLHAWFIDRKNLTLEHLLELFDEATGWHNAFVHIERELDKLDNHRHGKALDSEVKNFFAEMVALAKAKNIWLEVNESSIRRNSGGDGDRLRYWIKLARDNGNKIYLGSDAHFAGRVGDFKFSLELLNEVDYPKNLILNCDYDQLAALRSI
ncbi:MAG: PHP domain-containing protein [Selenomonadaceae bacterium]|nr:PHP domain-containing protein [Selenomonadaceae bacterium]